MIESCIRKTHPGRCHCGAVRFEVDAAIDHVRACDCSVCRRRGALLYRVAPSEFRLLTPIDALRTYRWNTGRATDYFCATCGVLPFRHSRTEPGKWDVNVRCLEAVELDAIPVRRFEGSRLSG